MQGHSSILLVFCLVSGCLSAPPPPFLEYQDTLGQYKFGYSAPGSARSEVRSIDGVTSGAYSYVDASGMIQSAEYTADGERGFQITATNLPQAPKPVEETPEVTAARLNHLKAFEKASTLAQEIPEINVQPVIAVSDGKATDSVVIENASDEKAKSQNEGNGSVTKVTARIGIAEGPAGSEENSGQPGRVEFSVPIPVLPQAAAFIVPISHSEARASIPIPEGNSRFEVNSTKPSYPKTIAIEAEVDQSSIPQVADSVVPISHSEARASIPIPGIPEGNSRFKVNFTKPSFHYPKSIASQQEQGESLMPHEQAASVDPSAITPAGTKLSLNAGSETSGMIGESLAISGANEEAAMSSGRAQLYSAALTPRVQIIPSTTYQHVTYGIGINPFFNVYNPYNSLPVFRYGIF